MKLTLITVLLLLSGSAVYAQTESGSDLPVGTVIDRVVVRADPSQSYAAYVPISYSAKSPSAVIYCFDPLARGKFALERFQTAAEKYGYIVVCSNNSHNGQDNETATHVIAALENDVRRRFNIDPARVYAAGFSGGARLAVSLAMSCGKCVAGVLATGAGFPPNLKPTPSLPFAFFGAVGVDDFNYGELRELQAKMQDLSLSFRIETFSGGHEWMDPTIAEHALAWFNLIAMKNGTLPRNDKFIDEQFEFERNVGAILLSNKKQIDAYYHELAAASTYRSLRDVTSFNQNVERIRASREFRGEVVAEQTAISGQRANTESLFESWLRGEGQYGDAVNGRAFARDHIRILQKQSELEHDTSERRVARRILIGVLIGSIESGRSLEVQKKYRLAIPYYELAAVVRPHDPEIAYELARHYALDGKKRQALNALEDAFAFGFQNRERIQTDSALDSLAKDPRFQKLLNQLP